MRRHFHRLVPLFTLLALVATASFDHAGVLILKDGTTLIGKIRREGQSILEGGQMVKIGNGFWALDDDHTLPERKDFYVRRFIYSQRLVQDVDDGAVGKPNEWVVLRQPLTPFVTAARIEPIGPILGATEWDINWERQFKFQPLKQPVVTTKQRITTLTPYCFCVESSRFLWQQMYLTRELGPERTVRLLYSHPELREPAGTADPAKRTRIIRFLKQAGFYDAAERELDLWMKDAPGDKARIEEERGDMRRLRSREMLDELERAHKAGRHVWVEKRLPTFPQEFSDSKALRALQAKYETADESLTAARRLLNDLPPKVSPEAHRVIFTEAAAAILRELNIDNHERLDTFVALGKQAERDAKAGRPVAQTPGDLMALAVSGWLLGNGSAEAKAAAGIRLWHGRRFVFEYLKTATAPGRQQLAEEYQKTESEALAYDELAQLISLLPPIEPEEKLATDVMPLETKLPWAGKQTTNYLVQLPREYTHGRAYPVLVVLHQAIEKPAETLGRWMDLAQQHGYILIAPEWGGGNARPGYNYSAEEHQAVLDSLRDLQRRFNVDSDRVFLAGAGQGGDMAYDIGLSHPDLFAGVAVMGAQPRYFAKAYALNGYHLPFYVVAGELASEAPKAIREQFKTWVLRGHPSLYVEYKGRGQEWFAGELPNIFDWMNRKKRATATPELPEVWSMRPTDNRFYWLSGDSMNKASINSISNWRPLLAPATLQGRIAESNTINLYAKNYRQVTLWLAPGMVDFGKPVTVMLNTGTKLNQRMITPNIGTLLEDFYLRGDRQRLYVAKIELNM